MGNLKETLGAAATGLIAIFITLAIATGLGTRFGGLGGGIVTVMSWGFFYYIGWIGNWPFMMGLMAAVGLYMVKG